MTDQERPPATPMGDDRPRASASDRTSPAEDQPAAVPDAQAGGRDVERRSFVRWFDELAAIGRKPTGGWRRFAWTPEDEAARAWFRRTADSLELSVEADRNGNLWAWWGSPGSGAVVTGSHLDTVADAGGYDGALGVVSGFAAVDRLRGRYGDRMPPRPIAVVGFADEEGGRFNLPCCASRLMTGVLDPATILDREDADGTTLREAVSVAGLDPDALGADPERLGRIGALVELHVEQGRSLVDDGVALGVGTTMWPHQRWRLVLTGEANHAGTTRLRDRRDPTLVAAQAIQAARDRAVQEAMVATVGRLLVEPNSPNTIPGRVTASLDARASDDAGLERFVKGWAATVRARAAAHDLEVELSCEARTSGVEFDARLRRRIIGRLAEDRIPAVPLATAAGHDAGVLAARVPAAMLFVRNPTGASHTPSESATVEDCLIGVAALTAVLEELAWRD
jgi:N-carbamoyl-L-amino-acid hydrolase